MRLERELSRPDAPATAELNKGDRMAATSSSKCTSCASTRLGSGNLHVVNDARNVYGRKQMEAELVKDEIRKRAREAGLLPDDA